LLDKLLESMSANKHHEANRIFADPVVDKMTVVGVDRERRAWKADPFAVVTYCSS